MTIKLGKYGDGAYRSQRLKPQALAMKKSGWPKGQDHDQRIWQALTDSRKFLHSFPPRYRTGPRDGFDPLIKKTLSLLDRHPVRKWHGYPETMKDYEGFHKDWRDWQRIMRAVAVDPPLFCQIPDNLIAALPLDHRYLAALVKFFQAIYKIPGPFELTDEAILRAAKRPDRIDLIGEQIGRYLIKPGTDRPKLKLLEIIDFGLSPDPYRAFAQQDHQYILSHPPADLLGRPLETKKKKPGRNPYGNSRRGIINSDHYTTEARARFSVEQVQAEMAKVQDLSFFNRADAVLQLMLADISMEEFRSNYEQIEPRIKAYHVVTLLLKGKTAADLNRLREKMAKYQPPLRAPDLVEMVIGDMEPERFDREMEDSRRLGASFCCRTVLAIIRNGWTVAEVVRTGRTRGGREFNLWLAKKPALPRPNEGS